MVRLSKELAQVTSQRDEMSNVASRRQDEIDVIKRDQRSLHEELMQARLMFKHWMP